MKNLLKLCQRLRSSKDANSQSLAASLSTRQLIRIAHRLAATPQTHDREKLISDAVHKACLSRFLDLKNVDVSHVLSCAPLPTNHILKSNSNLLLYSLYYAEACNEFAGPISASLRLWATQLLSKKCCSGGEPLATLCLI